MKFRKLLSALLLSAGVLFVAGFTPADSPTEVAQKFIGALRNSDFAAVAQFCEGKMKAEAEQMGRQYNAANPEQQKQIRDGLVAFTDGIVLKNEKIEGDFAVIDIVVGGKPDKMCFKKVGGEWKMIDDDDYKKIDSPTEVEKKFGAAFKRCDFDAAAELCYGKQKDDVKQIGAQYANASPEEKQLYLKQMAGFSFSVEKEEIDGDYARLTITINGKLDFEYLKKVDGEWKVIDRSEYKK